MKKVTEIIYCCIIIGLLSACSTGQKAYQQGDYYKACFDAVERLRSKPQNEKAAQVLTSSYPLALKTAEREIQNTLLASEDQRYFVLVDQYERINRLADEIYHCPKAYELIPSPKEYIAELKDAKRLAADRLYTLGVSSLVRGDIDKCRAAYQFFIRANQYVPGYKDLAKKLEDARYEATLRVVVEKPLTSSRFQYSADFFYVNLINEMSRETRNKLVRFYTVDEARNENMKDPHQVIVLNFEDFTVGNVRETTNTRELTRDSVVVGTVQVNGKTYNSYNTVKAQLTVSKREILSGGVLNMKIIDASNNRVLLQRNFAGEYVWKTEWAGYKGDDRALTKDEKNMCSRQPGLAPPHQDLFVEFTRPIYSQAVYFVRSTYSGRY